jgi:hypothetical protein
VVVMVMMMMIMVVIKQIYMYTRNIENNFLY